MYDEEYKIALTEEQERPKKDIFDAHMKGLFTSRVIAQYAVCSGGTAPP
jgi:hypothetical protein